MTQNDREKLCTQHGRGDAPSSSPILPLLLVVERTTTSSDGSSKKEEGRRHEVSPSEAGRAHSLALVAIDNIIKLLPSVPIHRKRDGSHFFSRSFANSCALLPRPILLQWRTRENQNGIVYFFSSPSLLLLARLSLALVAHDVLEIPFSPVAWPDLPALVESFLSSIHRMPA